MTNTLRFLAFPRSAKRSRPPTPPNVQEARYHFPQGANQAAAAAKLGAESSFLGQLGADAGNQVVDTALRAAGVDVSLVSTLQEEPTGLALVFLLPGGENAIVIVGGANVAWKGISQSKTEAIQASDVLLLQREIPEDVNIEAARIAKAAGKLVVMDVGGREEPLSRELLSLIDVLSPNEVMITQTELERLTQTLGDVEASCNLLFSQGVKHLLLKLGSQGSHYISPVFSCTQKALSVPDLPIIDTTGAGDCFTAAFVVRMLELGGFTEQSIADSLKFASAAAFLSITKKGAMESMPWRRDVEELLTRV